MAEKKGKESHDQKHVHLVDACKRGDQKAMFEIYRLYYVAMYNTALRIIGDPDDAEDVMQEAFLKAFEKLKSFRGEVTFGAWLKRIVINRALDFLRMRREKISLDEVGEIEQVEDEKSDSLEVAYKAETIRRAIGELPEGYRIVLSLVLLEGYDHQEVSEILHISNATSRTQYHRAKRRLLELLKKNEEKT